MVTQIDPRAVTNALQEGAAFAQSLGVARAQRGAGNALAGGDVQGAMNALGGAGDLAGVQALQQGQAEEAEARRKAEAEGRKEVLTFVRDASMSLSSVPADQRDAVWQQTLRPVFVQMGFPEQELLRFDQMPKDDNTLRSIAMAVGGEIERPGGINVGGGRIVQQNPYTGAYEEVYTAPRDPLEEELMRARIASQNAQVEQRQASAARARRPAASGGGRSSGGGGSAPRPSGGGSALPPGFRIRGR